MHQRMGLNLPFSKPSGKSWSVLSFGFGVAELVLVHLLAVLLVNGFSFVHTVIYNANKQAHNQDTEIKDLSLSSNRKHIKYGVWSKVFEWIPKGMAETELRDTR